MRLTSAIVDRRICAAEDRAQSSGRPARHCAGDDKVMATGYCPLMQASWSKSRAKKRAATRRSREQSNPDLEALSSIDRADSFAYGLWQAVIERIFRFVEMIGVTALISVAIRPTHPDLAHYFVAFLSALAALYLGMPLVSVAFRKAAWIHHHRRLSGGDVATIATIAFLVIGAQYLTNALIVSIEAVLSKA